MAAVGLWWAEGGRYAAQATLALTRPDATLAFDERFRAAPIDPTFPYRIGSIRTYPELALADDIALRVRESLGDRVPAAWGPAAIRGRVRARAAAEGTLLIIEARAESPALAADIANTWADVFSRRMEALLGATAAVGPREDGMGAPAIDSAAGPAVQGSDFAGDGAAVRAPLEGAGGIASARATARAALAQAESALEAFHLDAAIDARSAEVVALDARYRSLLARRDRLGDVARDADRMADRLAGGETSGEDEALALLILRFESLVEGSGSLSDGSGAGGLSLRFDASTGSPPSAADMRALARDATDAGRAAELEAESLPERLAAARSTLAAAGHQRSDLERDRDLAGERLQALGRREAEVEAAAATSRPELLLAAAAIPPSGIDAGPLFRRALAAVVLGLLAGAALVIRAPGRNAAGIAGRAAEAP